MIQQTYALRCAALRWQSHIYLISNTPNLESFEQLFERSGAKCVNTNRPRLRTMTNNILVLYSILYYITPRATSACTVVYCRPTIVRLTQFSPHSILLTLLFEWLHAIVWRPARWLIRVLYITLHDNGTHAGCDSLSWLLGFVSAPASASSFAACPHPFSSWCEGPLSDGCMHCSCS